MFMRIGFHLRYQLTIRCYGHSVNIAANILLFSDSVLAFFFFFGGVRIGNKGRKRTEVLAGFQFRFKNNNK